MDDPASAGAGAPTGPVGPVQAFTTYQLDDIRLGEVLGGRLTSTGLRVGEKQALRNSTFFRSVNIIAGSIAMLPVHLMRRKADGTTEKAKDHPLYRVLHRRPNRYQTAFEFFSYMQTAALLDGNAYALIVRSRGQINQLVPLPRRAVTPELTDTFDLRFKYRRPDGRTTMLPAEEVFHFRHPVSLDGLKGVSLLDVAAESLGLATVAERAAGRLFKKGTMVSGGGALESDKTLGDEAIKNLKESLAERSGDEASEKWLILEEGLKAKLLGTNAKEAQHLEMRGFQAEEASRYTGIPRPLLMFDETTWGTGTRELSLFLITYCLAQWFVAWEEAISRSLLTEAEQDELYAKFNEGALLRGSLKEQAEFFAKALGNAPYLSPNEVREAFDRNPIEGGEGLPAQAGAASPEPEPAPADDPPSAPPKRKKDD